MSKRVSIITPGDRPRALGVVGTEVVPLLGRERTDGGEVTFQRGDEGHGPPLHRHDWEESFYVLEGGVCFLLGDREVHCAPGTLVHVPAGTLHGFRYAAGGGSLLEFTGAGSGAVALFTDLDASVPPGTPDIALLLGVLARNGVTVGG